jgi:hypothetical protein
MNATNGIKSPINNIPIIYIEIMTIKEINNELHICFYNKDKSLLTPYNVNSVSPFYIKEQQELSFNNILVQELGENTDPLYYVQVGMKKDTIDSNLYELKIQIKHIFELDQRLNTTLMKKNQFLNTHITPNLNKWAFYFNQHKRHSLLRIEKEETESEIAYYIVLKKNTLKKVVVPHKHWLDECIICYESNKFCYKNNLFSCKHNNICCGCIDKMLSLNNSNNCCCPECRSEIKNKMKLELLNYRFYLDDLNLAII